MNKYISDIHFGHANIISLDKRPFLDITEMDEMLIKNWNNNVQKDDHVWILGDFCFRSQHNPAWYLKQLKGKKHLIIGNHDYNILRNPKAQEYFESINDIKTISDNYNGNSIQVFMCHYPIAEWPGFFNNNTYHLYGHIHNAKNDAYHVMKKYDKAINVGCMLNNYKPCTITELIYNRKEF